jgi:hypothetical protein
MIVSLLVGGIIAQVLAVETGADQEWILVFAATVLIVIAATFVFFVVQLASGSRRAVGVTTAVLLVILAIFLAGLLIWTIWAGGADGARKDLPIIAGLVLPGAAVIVVQWLIVRWRAQHMIEGPRFGRGGEAS